MNSIFLGYPPENVKKWIKEHQLKPIAESEDGITKVMTFVDAVTGADRVITDMNDFVLDGKGLELAEDGGDGVTQVMFFGPGLEG